jgi:hypothetical protein
MRLTDRTHKIFPTKINPLNHHGMGSEDVLQKEDHASSSVMLAVLSPTGILLLPVCSSPTGQTQITHHSAD